jgi:tetratricopeptide (TPR) repeat protein
MLLERAQGQWRAGHMAESAGLYEEILARYPHDARTGLAALELGRIRMDHLGDLKGAVVSLQRAVRLAPAASFHEDALARLVQANDRLGRRGDCVRARDAYLTRYRDGIHAATVSKACE